MVALRRARARGTPRPRELIAKVCLLGDARSGKGPLIKRYVYSLFDDKYIPTIGTKVTKKSITYTRQVSGSPRQMRLTLLIWDILGPKQYARLHPVYYQGANAAIIVCDATAPDALESLRRWAHEFEAVVGRTPLTFVLNAGTDSPPETARVEGSDELACAFGAPVFRLRPGEDPTIDEMFNDLGARILDALAAAARSREQEAREATARRRPWLRRARSGRVPPPEKKRPASDSETEPESESVP